MWTSLYSTDAIGASEGNAFRLVRKRSVGRTGWSVSTQVAIYAEVSVARALLEQVAYAARRAGRRGPRRDRTSARAAS